VHLPAGPSQGGPLSEAEMLRGAELIMRYLLAFALDRDGAETSVGEIGPRYARRGADDALNRRS